MVFVLLSMACTLSSCMTPFPERFNKISLGTDKSEVIDSLGNPSDTQRSQSQDIWRYHFYQGHNRFDYFIYFSQGKVTNKIDPSTKQDEDKVLLDYEKLVKEKKTEKQTEKPPSNLKEL